MSKLPVALAAALLAVAGPAWSGGAPPAVVHPHLFNSYENVPPADQPPGPVTGASASSTQAGTDDAEDAFGNGDGPVEPDTFIFGARGAEVADNGNDVLGDGGETVDVLEWMTTSPVTILGYRLLLTQQDPFGRTVQLVSFEMNGVERDFFDNDGATGADNSTVLEILRPFNSPLEGTFFRLYVTRTSNGPRITEIDALTESFCGNGTVEGSEVCDDGNFESGDGCDATCLFVESVCGNDMVEDGEQCDDGNTVAGDGCDALCQSEVAPACPAAPDPACVDAGKATLSVKDQPGKDKLTAKLQAFAAATTQADFGNPATGSTRYDLCIYDPEEAFVRGLTVDEAGETCGPKDKPCWKAKGTKGWAYKDPEADASGVRTISATSGPVGKGKLQVQAGNNAAKGQDEMPVGIAAMLEAASSVTVQVRVSDGQCFEALLSTIKKADGVVFQGKAP